ncbi:glycosyltransferase family protein [Aquiflexum sp.]|uniref:glycosyltransferase family protein n=1 Tax=Aquiflexum sp. TaxID=1872584 RepID=UPI00359434C2
MKFLLIVQGEGRGHMTQAISMSQLLERNGHEVCAVCVGKSQRREIPEFFSSKIKAPIFLFESPNFVTDKKHKGIKLGRTISYNFTKINLFKKSLHKIDQLVAEYQPDIILNFYDLLGGLYNMIYQPACRYWTIGHQYLINHPDFLYPNGKSLQKLLFQLNTRITSFGSELELALSFKPLYPLQNGNTFVLPPLLRKEVKSKTPTKGDFYLTYMVNSGYSDEILLYANKCPEIKIEAFWDQKGAPEMYKPLENLTFHQLNDHLFLEKMSKCKGLITTAGFESVCEAMYLGKPVMMIPVNGQYEQACNAIDAKRAGAGIPSENFDFKKMESFLNSGSFIPTSSKAWVDLFEEKFFTIFNSLPNPKNERKSKLPKVRKSVLTKKFN